MSDLEAKVAAVLLALTDPSRDLKAVLYDLTDGEIESLHHVNPATSPFGCALTFELARRLGWLGGDGDCEYTRDGDGRVDGFRYAAKFPMKKIDLTIDLDLEKEGGE